MTTHPVPVARGDWQSSDLPDLGKPGSGDVPRNFAPDLERAAAVQAIRDYADWLEANPDVPAPTHLDGLVHPGGVTFEESVKTVRAFIAGHGAVKHAGSTTGWATLRLPGDALAVDHTVFTETNRAADGWL